MILRPRTPVVWWVVIGFVLTLASTASCFGENNLRMRPQPAMGEDLLTEKDQQFIGTTHDFRRKEERQLEDAGGGDGDGEEDEENTGGEPEAAGDEETGEGDEETGESNEDPGEGDEDTDGETEDADEGAGNDPDTGEGDDPEETDEDEGDEPENGEGGETEDGDEPTPDDSGDAPEEEDTEGDEGDGTENEPDGEPGEEIVEGDNGTGDTPDDGDMGDKQEKSDDPNTGSDAESKPTPPPITPGWENYDDEPSVGKYVIGFLALVAVVVYFKCIRKRGSGMPMSPTQNGKPKYQEVLTDEGDGDDWGWDDPNNNTGDVELASSHSARSGTDMPIPPPTGLSLKQRSPSIEKRDIVKLPSATCQIPSSQNNNKLPNLGQTSVQAQAQQQAQPITSLAPIKKTAPRPKPKEDDIFASMGLAVQPQFQASKPAVRSPPPSGSAASGWGSLAAAPLPRVTAPAPSFDGDAWGGDDDLDDLFDE